jgi:hypothetical protein
LILYLFIGFNSSSYDINVVKKYLPHILIKNSKQHGNISKKEKQWLQTIENQLQRNLEHNKKIERYNVDGYDKLTNTVYEFNGCFFHGCQKCYDSEEINPITGHKMKHHYQKTIMKEERLKELGYNVINVFECEFQPSEEIEINNIIKCNNKYKMISNGKFIFKDIIAYLSPGTSLEKYLRAFDTECPKGVFPHRVTQNVEQYLKEHPDLKFDKNNIIKLLKKSSIPEKKWFYNDLNKTKVSDCDYFKIKSNYDSLFQLLKDYNNSDVRPAVEATKKLSQFFNTIGLDIHKDGISIPGLSLKYLWDTKEKDVEFQLFKGNEELYQKYRDNLVGGPSIIFNHYQEKDKTLIRGGKLCKRIMGFDANALYLWAIGQPMLCGDHQRVNIYDDLLSDVLNGSFYGAIECDIEVPDHLKTYFSEMQPIFKNVDISFNNLSSDTQKQVKTNYQSKKLIGSFFGKKVLLITDVLQWYLQKGLVVSNITYAVRYEKKAPFKSFVDTVSNSRRAGDKSTDYKLIGEMMKLIGLWEMPDQL